MGRSALLTAHPRSAAAVKRDWESRRRESLPAGIVWGSWKRSWAGGDSALCHMERDQARPWYLLGCSRNPEQLQKPPPALQLLLKGAGMWWECGSHGQSQGPARVWVWPRVLMESESWTLLLHLAYLSHKKEGAQAFRTDIFSISFSPKI